MMETQLIITDGARGGPSGRGIVAARAEIAQSKPEDLRHTEHSVHGQREEKAHEPLNRNA